MPLTKLTFKPGIDKQNTEYGAEGGWIDCDNVRFRYGLPEKIGGWESVIQPDRMIIGAARDQITWASNNATQLAAVGTHKKLYTVYNNTYYDITPLSTTLPAVFTFTSGTTIVDVLSTASGCLEGDFVTFSTVSGVSVVNVNNTNMENEFEIVNIIDADNFQVDVNDLGIVPGTVTASGTAAGAAFQINTGVDSTVEGYGWGAGYYGAGTWGTARSIPLSLQQARIWALDTFGEDLIATIVGGRTYRLDTSAFLDYANGITSTAERATELTQAPDQSNFMLVSPIDRHLIFFGTETTPGSSTTFDPMSVLFGSQQSLTDFTPTSINTAGFQRLAQGNEIITAVRTRGDILILSDDSAHSMQFVGPPFTFSFKQIGSNCGAVGPHAAQEAENVVYWMSEGSFYRYSGTVQEIPCSVQDYVFGDIDKTEYRKIFAGVNLSFGEITWFYCSEANSFIDRCVTYNYKENVWTIGSLARTTWASEGTFRKPYATEYDPNATTAAVPTVIGVSPGRSIIYQHESGTNANGQPITAFIESGDMDIVDGDDNMFIRRYIPDFKNQEGEVEMQIKVKQYPGSSQTIASATTVYSTTTKVDMRARGRQIALKIVSDDLDTKWRYGTLRVDAQPDGKR